MAKYSSDTFAAQLEGAEVRIYWRATGARPAQLAASYPSKDYAFQVSSNGDADGGPAMEIWVTRNDRSGRTAAADGAMRMREAAIRSRIALEGMNRANRDRWSRR